VGPGCGIYTIRLDEKLDGRGMITAKGWNKCKQDAPYNEIRLTRRANDIGEIISAFDVAQLWLIYPQKIPERYDIEHDNICLDQSYTLIFERRDKAGYGFTQVDSCSIHAEKALDAAFKLRLLAGLSAHLSERP